MISAAEPFRDREPDHVRAGTCHERVEHVAVGHVLAQRVDARLQVTAVPGKRGAQREEEAARNDAALIEYVPDPADARLFRDRDLDRLAAVSREGLEHCPDQRKRREPGRHSGQPAQATRPHRRALK